jgi:hypothetical protein
MQTFSLSQFYDKPGRQKKQESNLETGGDNEIELSASGQEASLHKRQAVERIEETETENQTDIEQTRDMLRNEFD